MAQGGRGSSNLLRDILSAYPLPRGSSFVCGALSLPLSRSFAVSHCQSWSCVQPNEVKECERKSASEYCCVVAERGREIHPLFDSHLVLNMQAVNWYE